MSNKQRIITNLLVSNSSLIEPTLVGIPIKKGLTNKADNQKFQQFAWNNGLVLHKQWIIFPDVGNLRSKEKQIYDFIEQEEIEITLGDEIEPLPIELLTNSRVINLAFGVLLKEYLEAEGFGVLRRRPTKVAFKLEDEFRIFYSCLVEFYVGFYWRQGVSKDSHLMILLDPKIVAVDSDSNSILTGAKLRETNSDLFKTYLILGRKLSASKARQLAYKNRLFWFNKFHSLLFDKPIKLFGRSYSFNKHIVSEFVKLEPPTLLGKDGQKITLRDLYEHEAYLNPLPKINSGKILMECICINIPEKSKTRIEEKIKAICGHLESVTGTRWIINEIKFFKTHGENVRKIELYLDHTQELGNFFYFIVLGNGITNKMYAELKIFLIQKELRHQFIREETLLGKIDDDYVFKNLILNLLVKAGGIPWRIEEDFPEKYGFLGIVLGRHPYRQGYATAISTLYSARRFKKMDIQSFKLVNPQRKLILEGLITRQILEKFASVEDFDRLYIFQTVKISEEELEAIKEFMEKNSLEEITVVHYQINNLWRCFLEKDNEIMNMPRVSYIGMPFNSDKWLVFFTKGSKSHTQKPVILKGYTIRESTISLLDEKNIYEIVKYATNFIFMRYNTLFLENSKQLLPLYIGRKLLSLMRMAGKVWEEERLDPVWFL